MGFPWGDEMRPVNRQAYHGLHKGAPPADPLDRIREQIKKHGGPKSLKKLRQLNSAPAGRCSICGEYTSNLSKHKKAMHPRRGPIAGKCDFCGHYHVDVLAHMKAKHMAALSGMPANKGEVLEGVKMAKPEDMIQPNGITGTKEEDRTPGVGRDGGACPICGKIKAHMNAHLIGSHLYQVTRPVRSLKRPGLRTKHKREISPKNNKGKGGAKAQGGIRSVDLKKDPKGNILEARIVFGPHYFIELVRDKRNRVKFVLGATHHGFAADASKVDGELEKIIYEVRNKHPRNMTD